MGSNGYKVDAIISKNGLKNEEKFEEIKKVDERIIEKLGDYLSKKPKPEIYIAKKDKKIKVIYIFEKKEDENKNKYVEMTETIKTNDVEENILAELKEEIIELFAENTSLEGINVVWDNTVIKPKMLKVGKLEIPLGGFIYFVCVLAGLIIGSVLFGDDGWLWGMLLGLLFGTSSSTVIRIEKNKQLNKTNDSKDE